MIHAPWILSCRFFTKNIDRIHTEKPIKKALAKDWPRQDLIKTQADYIRNIK